MYKRQALGYALDRFGMQSTLLGLLAVFAPLLGLVLVPLVIRIRREQRDAAADAIATG